MPSNDSIPDHLAVSHPLLALLPQQWNPHEYLGQGDLHVFSSHAQVHPLWLLCLHTGTLTHNPAYTTLQTCTPDTPMIQIHGLQCDKYTNDP